MTAVGFTGTQVGMTNPQYREVTKLIEAIQPATVRHGDCIGADDHFNTIALSRHIHIEIHPPIIGAKRAFCHRRALGSTGFTIWPPKDYLARNQDIVDLSDCLIATPKEIAEELRSGTWSTVRRARKRGIPIFIVFPDGTVKHEGPPLQGGAHDGR